MDSEQKAPQLLCGDVTESQRYKDIAEKIKRSTFNKAKTEKIQKEEQSIAIKKIINNPFTYLISEAFYEERDIYDSCVPYVGTDSVATGVCSCCNYDKWQENCPAPMQSFTQEANTVELYSTRYVENCFSCQATGQVPCTNCTDGTEVCYNCNGSGQWRCGSCNGRGEVKCSRCYGDGYLWVEQTVGYDSTNHEIREKVKETCQWCGGRGTECCNTCGGSGVVICGVCNGFGNITCRTCGGSTWLVCASCSGAGHFLYSVKIDQKFDNDTILTVLNDYSIDSSVYGNKSFQRFETKDKDSLVDILVGEVPIKEIPLSIILSNQYKDSSYDMSKITAQYQLNGQAAAGKRKYLKYRTKVYQRDVLEVEYAFQNQTYHMMIDGSTEAVLLNRNPYEDVATNMLVELEEHAKAKRFKSFLEDYEEFLGITASDDVAYGGDDVQKFYKKLNSSCVGVALFSSCLAHFFSKFLFLGIAALFITGGFWRTIALALSLVASFGVSRLWKKGLSDKKGITYMLIAVLSILVTFVINYVFILIL